MRNAARRPRSPKAPHVSHYRKPLGAALALNTAIVVGEGIAGIEARSLSLLMDAVHNFSDELALAALFLAYVLPVGLSKNLQRSANLLNSLGLIAVSGVLVWQAIERLLAPQPVASAMTIAVGVLAALANLGVARLLRGPAQHNAAIRLAYLHNLGDVYVSLAPVVAGILITLTGDARFDPFVALTVAIWIIATTAREVTRSHAELIAPEKATCGPEH